MAELCSLANAVLETGFCAYTLPVVVSGPRSVLSVGNSDFLALERGTQSVILLFDSDDDGIPDSKRSLATADGLNHGLAIHAGFLYASSDTTVYRWLYESNFSSVGEKEVVIENINADGQGGAPQGHKTRTLVFDDAGRVYVSVGSLSNVDSNSYRARIRRFDLGNETLSIDFQTGEVFADGLRNEVGLAFDRHGVLWGVENGADELFRIDLGGDIHEDNPAEELNRFREEDSGKHWGYPFCWTEYKLREGVAKGTGTVWAWPSFLDQGVITDEQCRLDYISPVLAMQGHSAPLGITFYHWRDEFPVGCPNDAFPRSMDRYAFVAFHGSWNRDVPTGYKVVYIPVDENSNLAGEVVNLLAHEPPDANWEDGFRPVDVEFDDCGRLIVSSDGTNGIGSKIIRIQYKALDEEPSQAPHVSPSQELSLSPVSNDESNTPPSKPSIEDLCPCWPTNSAAESSGEPWSVRSRSGFVHEVFAVIFELLFII